MAIALLIAILLVPGSASAVEGMPDEMVDPIAAMEPEITLDEPAEDAGVAAQGNVAPVTGEVAKPVAPSGDTAAAAAEVPASYAPVGSGSLPFTGPDSGLLTFMFLVGSLTLAAGAVAFAHARVLAETA